jgi:alpha-ketoglutaric semialdehyde dehydrogenase
MAIPELQSYIGGTWRAGSATFQDLNPAHPEEVVAEVRMGDEAMAREAVEAARQAFRGWQALPAPARGEILRRAADVLEQRTPAVARDLTREEGKTVVEAMGECGRAVSILRYYSGQTLEPDGEVYPSHSATTLLYARREPLGVVGVITPYNFPIAIPAWKIAPALAYGNTVIWKPAGQVPLTATHLAQALIDGGIPEGAFNLILGGGSTVGPVLYRHEAVDAVTFTGSNELGRAIQREAVENGKKVQLEMGSKNPAIVLADADLGLAAEHVARGAFLSAGQKCTATSRVIVDRSILPEFTDRLVALAKSWKLGDPLEPDTRIGPLVSEDQMKTVLSYLSQARTDGGVALAGGERATDLGPGYYVPPTVVTKLPPESRVVREEIFGPVAVLLPASTYEEAIALANDTPFGLSASLFTRDLGSALRFAQDIRFGVVKINQESAGLEFQVPFGGMKGSSAGPREQGKVARDFFTQWKTVYVDPS